MQSGGRRSKPLRLELGLAPVTPAWPPISRHGGSWQGFAPVAPSLRLHPGLLCFVMARLGLARAWAWPSPSSLPARQRPHGHARAGPSSCPVRWASVPTCRGPESPCPSSSLHHHCPVPEARPEPAAPGPGSGGRGCPSPAGRGPRHVCQRDGRCQRNQDLRPPTPAVISARSLIQTNWCLTLVNEPRPGRARPGVGVGGGWGAGSLGSSASLRALGPSCCRPRLLQPGTPASRGSRTAGSLPAPRGPWWGGSAAGLAAPVQSSQAWLWPPHSCPWVSATGRPLLPSTRAATCQQGRQPGLVGAAAAGCRPQCWEPGTGPPAPVAQRQLRPHLQCPGWGGRAGPPAAPTRLHSSNRPPGPRARPSSCPKGGQAAPPAGRAVTDRLSC